MAKTNKKAAKKAAPAKTKKAPQGSSGDGAPRSAARGGEVPVERYAKDPKSVAKRLKEKADKAHTQAANAVVRAEAAGVTSPFIEKLQAAMGHFEAAKKALA